MKSFLIFLGAVVVIGLVWAVIPVAEKRSNEHVQRLVASLNLVEDAIVGSSTDILRVNLFSPEITPLPGDGHWKLSGIIETQGRAGKAVHVRYVSNVLLTCMPYEDPECGRVESLSIEGKPLIIDGAIVAELQSVLNPDSDPLGEALPGTSDTAAAAELTPLPLPQISTVEPETAPVAEASQASDALVTAEPAEPAPQVAAESQPATAAMAPAQEDEPTQGNRQIFLIQKILRGMGYDPGPVDGQIGPRTTSAIQTYQQRAGLEADGQPSAALLEHMIHAAE